MNNGTTKKLNIIFVVLLILCTAFAFTACNKTPEEPTSEEKNLYIVDTSFDEDAQVMTILIGLSGTDDKKLPSEASAEVFSFRKSDGSYYIISESDISLNGSAIFSAVNSMLTQDEKIYNGTLYSCLKVEFQYATIYKSIISKGVISRQGKYYIHTFMIDETDENQQISLVLRQQNSAAWYGTLAGCSLAVMLIAGMTCVIIRRKNGSQ